MIIPYKMDTIFIRYPVVNVLIVACALVIPLTQIVSMVSALGTPHRTLIEWESVLILNSALWQFFSLLINLFFLFVFGNSINNAVGNLAYPILFLAFCASAGVAHIAAGRTPPVESSGALCGIMGMALVLFPRNNVGTIRFKPFRSRHTASIRSSIGVPSMIAIWGVYDVMLLRIASTGTMSPWGHLAGFLVGITVGVIAIVLELVDTRTPSLIDLALGRAQNTVGSIDQPNRGPIHDQLVHNSDMNGRSTYTVFSAIDDRTTMKAKQPLILRPIDCTVHGSRLSLTLLNEGDPATIIKVTATPDVRITVHPADRIVFREQMTIHFEFTVGPVPEVIEFCLRYEITTGERYQCLLSFRVADRTLAPVKGLDPTIPGNAFSVD